MTDRRKQSLIAGGLTSSAGIFLSKALGILYVSPFTELVTESNTAYYAYAYSIYDLLLRISLAGLPFAMAALVAKYMVKDDLKTVILIRKLSMSIMSVFGFVSMLIVLIFSKEIATIILTDKMTAETLLRTQNVLMIISLALFVVPLLSSYRGFYQGLKYLKEYAFSQVLEQFSRILFLLGMGFLLVVILKKDAMWAVYFAVLSTSVSALIAIFQFLFLDRKVYRNLKSQAKLQESLPINQKEILIEMFNFSIPFFLMSIFSMGFSISNLFLFNRAMYLVSDNEVQIKLLYSMIMFTTNKLTSIPQVLAPGFSIAIIPYITAAYEKRDMKEVRKYITDAINTVLYLAIPLSLLLYFLSEPIYYVMYGAKNVALGSDVLKVATLIAMTGTISPVVTTIMMSLRMKRNAMTNWIVAFFINMISIVPLIYLFNFYGSILSAALASSYVIFVSLFQVRKTLNIRYAKTVRLLILMFFGMIAFYLVTALFNLMIGDPTRYSRIVMLIILGFGSIASLSAYFVSTYLLHVPQSIFGEQFADRIVRRFKR
ncbi:MAG: oligosaccharide flippase family protein [Erysipelotrichaceae bacterium]|nr:oligosaccharide flippase family protein [Erysipelotrichaceae bacterium]MDP3306149.1 oligosaccharide flippase family protein [Erysipelotrichaceae bacterium]